MLAHLNEFLMSFYFNYYFLRNYEIYLLHQFIQMYSSNFLDVIRLNKKRWHLFKDGSRHNFLLHLRVTIELLLPRPPKLVLYEEYNFIQEIARIIVII